MEQQLKQIGKRIAICRKNLEFKSKILLQKIKYFK